MSKVTFEATPNPATYRFSSQLINVAETVEFTDVNQTGISPLAQKIYGFPWTAGVLLGPGFMTVTKQDWVDWTILAEPLANIISEHLDSGQPVLLATPKTSGAGINENDSDLVKSIKLALDREIKPVVALDGGDIAFHDFQDGHLVLKMMGSCSGCPSSQVTLKEGIEVRMKELFPEIREVHAL